MKNQLPWSFVRVFLAIILFGMFSIAVAQDEPFSDDSGGSAPRTSQNMTPPPSDFGTDYPPPSDYNPNDGESNDADYGGDYGSDY